MPSAVEHVAGMRDHWWWRPGWRVGRHYHACHFAMARHPELVELATAYQSVLGDVPGLDLIPTRWLHLTTQGVGFLDRVTDEELARLVPALRAALSTVPAPEVTFHRPVVRGEAVYLPATPSAPVAEVRSVLRDVIGAVLGDDHDELVAERGTVFRPHVSVAYSNAEQDATPIVAALDRVRAEPVTVRLDQIELLRYHRDNRMYEWISAEPLPIGR